MFLRTIEELEALEQVPLAVRLRVRSTYELMREVATHDPERTAIALLVGRDRSDQAERLCSRAFLNSMHQTANLLADLGIEPGDVIALLLPDLVETHLMLWAGQAAGIVCPVSPWLPGEQIVSLLQAVEAKLLVAPGPGVSQELWQKAEAASREVKSTTTVLQVRGPGKERDGIYAFDALLEDYPSDCLHTGRDIALDDIAVYLPTGNLKGTLGLLPLTHGNLLYAAWALSLVTRLAPEEVLLGGLWRFMQTA